MSDQLDYLCDILIWQNNAICQSISKGKFDETELYKYFKETARENKLFKKTLSHGSLLAEPHDSLPVEPPRTQEEYEQQYEDEEHEKLVLRIEKIKEKRQQDIENDNNGAK